MAGIKEVQNTVLILKKTLKEFEWFFGLKKWFPISKTRNFNSTAAVFRLRMRAEHF